MDHVLELFTSQGCVSCPPADRILTRMAARSDVLALAYHVDYWDYIGWRDTLGSAANTERQRDYASAFSTSTIYTPQLVVNGWKDVIGSREAKIEAVLKKAVLPPAGIQASVSMRLEGERLHITADADGVPAAKPMPILILVTFAGKVKTRIESGQNSGKTIVSTHPVRDWRVLGMWQGEQMTVDLPADMLKKHLDESDGDSDDVKGGCAVLLQTVDDRGAPGQILAAAQMQFGFSGTP